MADEQVSAGRLVEADGGGADHKGALWWGDLGEGDASEGPQRAPIPDSDYVS
jgi:hypothetical protein